MDLIQVELLTVAVLIHGENYRPHRHHTDDLTLHIAVEECVKQQRSIHGNARVKALLGMGDGGEAQAEGSNDDLMQTIYTYPQNSPNLQQSVCKCGSSHTRSQDHAHKGRDTHTYRTAIRPIRSKLAAYTHAGL